MEIQGRSPIEQALIDYVQAISGKGPGIGLGEVGESLCAVERQIDAQAKSARSLYRTIKHSATRYALDKPLTDTCLQVADSEVELEDGGQIPIFAGTGTTIAVDAGTGELIGAWRVTNTKNGEKGVRYQLYGKDASVPTLKKIVRALAINKVFGPDVKLGSHDANEWLKKVLPDGTPIFMGATITLVGSRIVIAGSGCELNPTHKYNVLGFRPIEAVVGKQATRIKDRIQRAAFIGLFQGALEKVTVDTLAGHADQEFVERVGRGLKLGIEHVPNTVPEFHREIMRSN